MELKKKNWNDISINDYYRILDITNDMAMGDMEKNLACLAICCEVSEEEVYELGIPEAQQLLKGLEFMKSFSYDGNFSLRKIKLAGEEYIINPDMQDFTVAQYVDFQNFSSKKDLRTYYGNILACFIVPKGKKYGEEYDVARLAERFRDIISIKLANDIMGFFLRSLALSYKATQMYLMWKTRRLMRKTKDKQTREILEKSLEQMQDMSCFRW